MNNHLIATIMFGIRKGGITGCHNLRDSEILAFGIDSTDTDSHLLRYIVNIASGTKKFHIFSYTFSNDFCLCMIQVGEDQSKYFAF